MNPSARLEKLQALLEKLNQPKFRFEQIKSAIYKNNFTRYSQITNLSRNLREQIIKALGDDILTLEKVTEVEGDNAHKVLFATRDDQRLETVRLSYRDHTALCLSTQAGCALGCTFCATGAMGFKKNLSVDEITDQLLYFQKQGHKIDSLIFMGMGEPLSNPLNTFKAIEIFTDPNLCGLSRRRLSVSTVGIIPGIERLTREYPEVNLALSLHSPFPDQRRRLMPITTAYPIDKVLAAIDQHLLTANRKVFISYILLKDVNDKSNHATALSNLIKATPDRLRLLHVNLIRYNPGQTPTQFQKSDPNTVRAFQAILDKNKVKNTLRQDFGVKISAACGQLAASSN